jgi:Mg/Co/Ni transporter MgtE
VDESGRGLDVVQALLERGDRRRLLEFLNAAHPADIAQILHDLPLDRQVAVFRLLTGQRAGEVLSELDDQTLLDLVQALDQVEVSRILEQMPPDHAAEVVEELPSEQAENLLDLMRE